MTENEHTDAAERGGIGRHDSSQDEDNVSDGRGVEDSPTARETRINAPPLCATTTTDGPTPRVRFSADMERARPVNGASPSTQHSSSPAGIHSGNTRSRTITRPGTTDITVDTTEPISELSSVYQNARSQLSSINPSRLLPTSPKTRDRGYSLRRTLFARGINERVAHHLPDDVVEFGTIRTSTIEPQPEGPSQQPAKTNQPTHNENLGKKPPQERNIGILPSRSGPALPHYASWRNRSSRISIFARVRSTFSKARKAILRINELQPSKDGRKIDLDAMRKSALIDERTGREYIGNTMRSSRYTLWNFLPRQLFAQFSKLANLSVPV
jgi:phospholipid-translocating ATPase